MPTKQPAATRIADSSRKLPARSQWLPSPSGATYVPDEFGKRSNPARPRIRSIVRTAYHEAGHAVLSSAICDTPREVTIARRRSEYSGRTMIMGQFAQPNVLVQVYLAGLAADHLLVKRIADPLKFAVRGTSFLRSACLMNCDIRCAVKCVQQLSSSKRHKNTLKNLMRFYAITRDSLRATWPAVVSVADALLIQRTLDRDALFEALDAHDIYHAVIGVQKAYGEM